MCLHRLKHLDYEPVVSLNMFDKNKTKNNNKNKKNNNVYYITMGKLQTTTELQIEKKNIL